MSTYDCTPTDDYDADYDTDRVDSLQSQMGHLIRERVAAGDPEYLRAYPWLAPGAGEAEQEQLRALQRSGADNPHTPAAVRAIGDQIDAELGLDTPAPETVEDLRINLDREHSGAAAEHVNRTTQLQHTCGLLEFTGVVSWQELPCWKVELLIPGTRGATRRRWLGQLWQDTLTGRWWAQIPGKNRADAQRFNGFIAALDWLDTNAPAWKPAR